MDYKITNFDVATEKLCLDQTAELPLEADFSVADYLGDIKKVLKCRITPFITSKQISGNALTVEGISTASVIYCDSEGFLSSAETEIPFKKTFESGKILEEGSAEVYVSAHPHSVRAVTEKRLSIRGSVKLTAAVTLTHKKQIIADIDSDSFELLKGEASATTPIGLCCKSFLMEEEISINEGMPPIKNIIRDNCEVVITETKIISNKAIIKGDLKIFILYCSLENTLKSHSAVLPFNQIIEMENITEECSLDAKGEICNINLSCRTAPDGTCKSLLITCKLLLTAKAYCNNSVPVILDAYSTCYKTDITKETVTFLCPENQIEETFLCKKKLTLPGMSNNVVDIWCNKNPCFVKTEENRLVLSSSLEVSAIILDENGEYIAVERNIDFEYPINTKHAGEDLVCKPQIEINGWDFTPTSGGEIELTTQITVKATILIKSKVTLITELSVDNETPLNLRGASLIAYYAQRGETIWEISKSFLANMSRLIEINNLKEELIETPKMLLIPRL